MNAFVESALRSCCETFERMAIEESAAGGGAGAGADTGATGAVYVRFEAESPQSGAAPTFDGFNSETVFGRVVYQNGGGGERRSPSLMLKSMPRTVAFIKDGVRMQYFNEIAFYARALPVLQQQQPQQQGAADVRQLLATLYDSRIRSSAGADQFVLVFEDLRARGFRMADAHAFLDLDHLSLMLRALGNFHAYSYRAKAENPLEFRALAKWFYDTQHAVEERFPNFMRARAERGLQRLRQDARYAHRLRRVEEMVKDGDQFMSAINTQERGDGMSVLCHGDYLRGNVMFRYDERSGKPCQLKMVDMACCRVASPVVDLSTVLYLNADQATRRRHWRTLIDAYHRGLCEPFGADAVPSVDRILGQFRTKALYGYFVASYFLIFTLALDRGTPTLFQLVTDEYANCSLEDVPEQIRDAAYAALGGDEGTEAIADVLRDMIDRNFV